MKRLPAVDKVLLWADRDRPSGRVMLWRNGTWEPNAGRREFVAAVPGAMRRRLEWTYPAATPLVSTGQAWHDSDGEVDAFWGPAVHWNTALEQRVAGASARFFMSGRSDWMINFLR